MVLKIVVDGEATIPRRAERAVLSVEVSSTGKTKPQVTEEVITTAKHLRTMLEDLSRTDQQTDGANAQAAVAHWSMNSLNTTSNFVSNNKHFEASGEDGYWTYTARTTFDIRFRDFDALGPFATKLAALQHVKIHSVEWTLTQATRRQYDSELRKQAAADALQRAKDYAEALGVPNVKPIEISEGQIYNESGFSAYPRGGVGGAQLFGQPRALQMQTANVGSEVEQDFSSSDLAFQPEEVRMHGSVSCKFEAS